MEFKLELIKFVNCNCTVKNHKFSSNDIKGLKHGV